MKILETILKKIAHREIIKIIEYFLFRDYVNVGRDKTLVYVSNFGLKKVGGKLCKNGDVILRFYK